jgi:hypothetical protein
MKKSILFAAAIAVSGSAAFAQMGNPVPTIMPGAMPAHATAPFMATKAHSRGPSTAYTGSSLAHRARVSMSRATTLALSARHGRVVDRELERERGGSGLRYSFDIMSPRKVRYEVGVDARTGRILENKVEGKNPD